MVFEIASPFLCIFNAIPSEKRGLISVPFLTSQQDPVLYRVNTRILLLLVLSLLLFLLLLLVLLLLLLVLLLLLLVLLLLLWCEVYMK